MTQRFRTPSHARPARGFFYAGLLTRACLSLALAASVLLGLVPARGVFARQGGEEGGGAAPRLKAEDRYVIAPDSGVFIISQDENGDTNCRVATPDETRRLRATGAKVGLRQINHLERLDTERFNTNGAVGAEGTANAVAAGMTIILRGTPQLEQNQAAKAAFVRAAAKWEALVSDPITIIIDVDFGTNAFGEPFPSRDILGITGSQGLFFAGNYGDVRQRLINHASGAQELSVYNALPSGSLPTDLGSTSTVVVQSPALRALGAIDPVANPAAEPNFGDPPQIGFNSAFGFDFDPTDGITPGQTDFDAVAVHEIGHALGFDSFVGVRDLSPSSPVRVALWDIFRFRPGAGQGSGFTNAARVLSTGGEQVYFDGGAELRLSTGDPEGNGGDEEQASHWKDDRFSPFQFIGIMDPTIPRGRREELTANDIRALNFFGFSVGAAPAAPSNDNFGSAQGIVGFAGAAAGTNSGATKEAGEPNHAGNTGGRSVWYRWVAPASGTVTFDTVGSTLDTTLAAYAGASVGGLSQLASNDDISLGDIVVSSIQFPVQAGGTYSIAVDGYNGGVGSVTLNWSLAAGPSPSNTVNTAGTAVAAEGGSNFVDITVTRAGDLSVPATVDYATSDVTANSRTDYLPAFGTLLFAAGEGAKAVRVFITDDSYAEERKRFNFTLSNPVNCNIGGGNTEVFIDSNEAAPGPNPTRTATFNSDFFVRQHYRDFLNRDPDASGLAFWKGQIDSCGADAACAETRRINVSAAFFLSIEFQQTGYLVYRAYQAAFGTGERLPLRSFLPDTQQIGRGVVVGQPGADQLLEQNRQAYFNGFVNRQAFRDRYPLAMTAAQFVDALNANTGGSLSQGERDALVADMKSGARGRAQVLRAVVEDADFNAREKNRAFVLTQYFGYLRRNPPDAPELTLDFQGYNFWLTKLNQFGGNFVNAEMVKAFITSEEYKLRFGP